MRKTASSLARRAATALLAACLAFSWPAAAFASDIPQSDTPDYKVAFYAFDNYHMQDESGVRSGYGYEMMQEVSKHMQCTFSYVGYDKTPAECIEMLRDGEIDIYTAAKVTDERAAEFAISTHPAITATTSMNVKVGNTKVVAGDYSTYDGLRIGLLSRHTYNSAFLEWVRQKGFDCDIVYYETPAELSNALVNDEVDALVNSYIRTPEDERTVEEFGQTPYYIMARQEDRALIDAIDDAIDAMNVETPNWRTDLFNTYYGAADKNVELTESEQAMLSRLQAEGAVVRGVMDPDGNPYSWYENGEARGIAADIFRACAQELGLACEIVPVETRQEYLDLLDSGAVDVWMDLGCGYEDEGEARYRVTDPYMTTTVSTLRMRGDSGPIERIAVIDYDSSMREIVAANWPDAQVAVVGDTQECVARVESGEFDAALLMTYTAQNLRKSYYQNSLQVDIVPGATLELHMGVNARDDVDFFGVWEKTLSRVAERQSGETVQSYIEEASELSPVEYFFNHPVFWVVSVALVLLVVFLTVLFVLTSRSRHRQKAISDQLAEALAEAERATAAKQNFFSKMSHDIRTPLNVVLGMTQIARTSKDDPAKFDRALDSITSEGNYLLMLINSILDVNQIEYGHVELKEEAFNPARSVRDNVGLLMPLAEKKQQKVSVSCSEGDCVVVGDVGRFEQIVMNIVSNAIKYTGNGGEIDVKLTCSPDGACRFTCTDNGIGMSREFIGHITEDYARAEDSRVSKVQGTGLGMSVVKGFTDLMGGTLSVESELGRGSTFTVDIPFSAATPEQRAALGAAADEQQDCDFDFTGKKVLLAEDNELNAEIAIELLQSIGLTVDWAEDGRLACERFEASRVGEYCAVFMDMQMPVMNGLDATRAIRSMERADSVVPIFAMTANTFVSDRNRCIDAGMTGYIPKPIHIDEIATTLKKTLE